MKPRCGVCSRRVKLVEQSVCYCGRCSTFYCSKHRLPEMHECKPCGEHVKLVKCAPAKLNKIWLPIRPLSYVDCWASVLPSRRLRVILRSLIIRVNVFWVFPELSCSQAKSSVRFCFIPEYLVGEFVTFGVVVDYQAFVVFSALVHDLSKAFKRWKHTRIVFVYDLPILNVGFSKDENVINVCAKIRRYS